MFKRQGYQEGSALAKDALGRNRASMALGDSSTHRKTDAGAFVFLAAVQSLEDGEDAVEVLFLEADPVVFHRKNAGIAFAPGLDLDDRRDPLAVKLHRVS